MQINVTVKSSGPSKVAKQVTFATARALTAAAKEAQTAVISDIESTFTVRNNWDKPSNKMGIRITAATKEDLTAVVRTDADWLIPHEEGAVKQPEGHNLAIPTENVRRTKRQMIVKNQRPRALLGKRDVVLKTKSGPVLFQRKGPKGRSQLVALYNLESSAHIRRESTVYEPTLVIVDKRFGALFEEALVMAFATAK